MRLIVIAFLAILLALILNGAHVSGSGWIGLAVFVVLGGIAHAVPLAMKRQKGA